MQRNEGTEKRVKKRNHRWDEKGQWKKIRKGKKGMKVKRMEKEGEE